MDRKYENPGNPESNGESADSLLQQLQFYPALYSDFMTQLHDQIAHNKVQEKYTELESMPHDHAGYESLMTSYTNETYDLEEQLYDLGNDFQKTKSYCQNTPGFENAFPNDKWIKDQILYILTEGEKGMSKTIQ